VSQRIEVTTGPKNADFTGKDHLALQGAVDYVTALGGGTVRILPGTYEMGNSLFLRDDIHVVGSGEDTVLHKCPSQATPLVEEMDCYSTHVVVKDGSIFKVGGAVLVQGKSPFYDKHQYLRRTVTAIEGNTIHIDNDGRLQDFWLEPQSEAKTVFSVITGLFVKDAVVENLTIDGNRAENEHFNGCFGAALFLEDSQRTVIRNVTARDCNGDGINWQTCEDITVDGCRSINNADCGLHPGTGNQRPIMTNNTLIGNKWGLFYCWGVKNGIAENNVIEEAQQHGITIGHHDVDNIIRNNQIRRSGMNGILFRKHPNAARDPHRNVLEQNLIVDSGTKGDCAGIEMLGTAEDVVLRGNRVVDTRRKHKSRKRIGLRIGPDIKGLQVEDMEFRGMEKDIVDQRR